MSALFTPEIYRQTRILLHRTMAQKAERHARYARACLETGLVDVSSDAVDRYEEDMRECRRRVRVLANA